MKKVEYQTYFASPERADVTEIKKQSQKFIDYLQLGFFLDAVPNFFVILNKQRQIVYANKSFLDYLNRNDYGSIYGQRLGEAINCAHADENSAGCGTSEHCATCGAVNAMLSAIAGKEDVQECRISLHSGDSLDLRIWATPLEFEGEEFIICSVMDISNEKRRQILERVFFHDILNTAGGLKGLAELIADSNAEEVRQLQKFIAISADRLVDEIKGQRLLNNAENNQLSVVKKKLNSIEFLQNIIAVYEKYDIAVNKYIQLAESVSSISFESDNAILGRVVGNMIKNALEAIRAGETVTVGSDDFEDSVRFWVNNPGEMRPRVKLQIFKRSFSTKGRDRGVGTYSIKLLTERFLGGKAQFISNEESGTTFFVTIPKKMERFDESE